MPMIVPAPASTKPWWRKLWTITVRALRGVILLDDTPYRIAMGSACGIFSSVLPVIGQTFVGVVLAKIFRGSIIASLPWSWISNPATTLPIWFGCYLFGAKVMRTEALPFEEIKRIFTEFSELNGSEVFMRGIQVIGEVFMPTLVGSCLIGVVIGAIGYLIMSRAVVAMHNRRERRRREWQNRTISIESRSPAV